MTTDIFDRLAGSRIRSRFRLGLREVAYIETKGRAVIRSHAVDLVAARLAPAHSRHDGRQTSMRCHPAFITQHATATCCRSCLAKWHGIPPGRELTDAEQDRVVDCLMAWIERAAAGRR